MRFSRLDLACFGHFREQSLEFPRTEQDFHLIVGRNEAGKSTLRAALGDFLFGIGHQTPWAFRYDGAELALAARLDVSGGSLELVRRKRRKAALQDADGREVAEGVLAAALGGVSREFFERMCSLDHAGLRAGGQRILESSDDTGRQLFEAAAGIGSFGPLREALGDDFAAIGIFPGGGGGGGGGRGGRGGQNALAVTGDYKITILVGGTSYSKVLRIERVSGGEGGAGFFGLDGAGREPNDR